MASIKFVVSGQGEWKNNTLREEIGLGVIRIKSARRSKCVGINEEEYDARNGLLYVLICLVVGCNRDIHSFFCSIHILHFHLLFEYMCLLNLISIQYELFAYTEHNRGLQCGLCPFSLQDKSLH